MDENNKKMWIFGLVLLMLIIGLIVIYVFFSINKNSFCNNIQDERIKETCKSCEKLNEPIDCKDQSYVSLAILNGNLSFCEEITQSYKKDECLTMGKRAIGMMIKQSKISAETKAIK